MRIHIVFNTILLKPYKANGNVKPLPTLVVENLDTSYELKHMFYNLRLKGVIPILLNPTSSSGLDMSLSINFGNLNLVSILKYYKNIENFYYMLTTTISW